MGKEKRELTCINCPLGCSVTVELEDGQILSVSGNSCPRGDVYARKEVTNPTRVITSSVPVAGGVRSRVSVKTSSDIPKDKLFACMQALSGVIVNAPVHIGDVVVKNAADTGVDIVATGNCAESGFL